MRKNITLPRSLDERIRKTARKRGTTQSGLIVQLVEKGLASEASQVDRVLAFAGVLHGPPDLSETIDETLFMLDGDRLPTGSLALLPSSTDGGTTIHQPASNRER